jgi:hypothetical protein
MDFDETIGDLDRVEKIFSVIDSIMLYDMDWLQKQLKDSVEYNYHYLRSTEFINNIKQINQQAVDLYQSGS